MAAGSVVVDLLMRTGQFETDTDRATKILNALDKSINRQVDSLKLQAAQLGKTAREAKLYDLALQGATPSQLKAAESALAQVEAHNKLQAAQKLGAKAMLAIGAGAIAAAVAFEKLIGSTAKFKDLEEQTGATAEDLASLAIPAAVAGSSVEDLAGQMNKLTKSLTGVDDDSKAAGAALAALGIPIKEFKKLDPVGQIDALSKAFNSFADGSEKSAIALALFGKSGASTLNVFKELGAEGGRQVILTQQQIELADDYADRQARLLATIQQYASVAAVDMLPALNALTTAFMEGIAELTGLDSAGRKIAGANPVKEFAEDAGRAVASLMDYVAQSTKEFSVLSDFIGTVITRGKQLATLDIAGANKTSDDFRARYGLDSFGRKQFAADGAAAGTSFLDGYNKALAAGKAGPAVDPNQSSAETGRLGRKRTLDFKGPVKSGKAGTDTRGAELKKSLDGELKLIQDFGRDQADAFRFGQQYLDGVYQSGLISQADYFATRKQVRDAALADQLAASDKETAALQKFAANPLAKPTDRVSANEKIKLSEQQRADAITKASAADILAAQADAKAVEQLQDRYTDLLATIKTGAGDEFGATALKNAKQVRDAARLVAEAGGDPAMVEQLRQQLDYRAQAAQQQTDYAKLLDETHARETEIYLDAVAGGQGELQTLAAIRDARMQAIGLLKAQAVAAAELAALTGNAEDIKRANDLALALKQAAAEIDPLATKFNSLFEDSFSNAFSGFLTGAKSAKDAFKDFANSVINEIANIAAKNLAKQVFGDKGGSSGIGGLLSSIGGLFGSSGGTGYATNTTGTSLPTAGGAATGTNFVERDMLTILHKGEAVVPKAYNPVNGGGGVTIINQASGVQVRPAGKDADGNPRLIVEQLLDQATQRGAADFQSGSGPMAIAARTRFGLGAGSLPKRG